MDGQADKVYGGLKQVFAVSAGLFLVFLDTTIVNIALPDMTRELHISLSTASWVINAFVITVAVLLVAFGKMADIFGSYHTYMVGLLLFMVASLLCGIAPNATSLIVFRVFQGIGAVTVIPASMILVRAAVPPEKAGTAMGIWGGIGALAIAAGPSLGGMVTEFLDWRWIFYLNIPVVLVCFPLTILAFRNHQERRLPFKMDFPGVISLGITMFFLTYAILQGQEFGWWSAPIVASFIISAISAALFIFIERKVQAPLVDLSILKDRIFSAGLVANFLSGILLMGTLILLPIYFTDVKGFDVLTASLLITPLSATMLIVAPLIGRLMDKVGYLLPMMLGYGFAIAGFFLLSRIQANDSNGYLILVMAIAGTGVGILMVTSVTIGTASVQEKYVSLGSSVFAMVRNMGGAVGVALFVSLTLSFSSAGSTTISTVDLQAIQTSAAMQQHVAEAMGRAFLSGLILSVLFIVTLPMLRKIKHAKQEV